MLSLDCPYLISCYRVRSFLLDSDSELKYEIIQLGNQKNLELGFSNHTKYEFFCYVRTVRIYSLSSISPATYCVYLSGVLTRLAERHSFSIDGVMHPQASKHFTRMYARVVQMVDTTAFLHAICDFCEQVLALHCLMVAYWASKQIPYWWYPGYIVKAYRLLKSK